MLEHISAIEPEVESLNIKKEPMVVIPIDAKKEYKLDPETPTVKPKVDVVGKNYYGDFFEKYNRIGEIKEFIPPFKEFYYECKIKDPKCGLLYILQTFNKEQVYPQGKQFHPYPTQVKSWTTKWNKEINEKRLEQGLEIIPKTGAKQVIKTRDEADELILGSVDTPTLETGLNTLAGELMNDALQTMRDTQELEETFTQEELVKRKNYVLNVMAHTTRLVHGKQALMLKASEEKRNNASFLMTLLAKASSGQMSDEELEMLSIPYKKEEQHGTVTAV